jgi:hypothetical protein
MRCSVARVYVRYARRARMARVTRAGEGDGEGEGARTSWSVQGAFSGRRPKPHVIESRNNARENRSAAKSRCARYFRAASNDAAGLSSSKLPA